MININLIIQSLPALLSGALITLYIALAGCFIGLVLGTFLSLLYNTKQKLLQTIITLYATIIRGTPMLIHIYFVIYVLPQLGVRIPTLWGTILAIGINSSAYVTQIIRMGIASVSKGQQEAAYTLGLTKLETVRYIILPQAFRATFPALGNELITLVKDSSLASIVGIVELSKQGSLIISRTYDALSIYTAVTLIYLIITSSISFIMHTIEKRMNHHAHH